MQMWLAKVLPVCGQHRCFVSYEDHAGKITTLNPYTHTQRHWARAVHFGCKRVRSTSGAHARVQPHPTLGSLGGRKRILAYFGAFQSHLDICTPWFPQNLVVALAFASTVVTTRPSYGGIGDPKLMNQIGIQELWWCFWC